MTRPLIPNPSPSTLRGRKLRAEQKALVSRQELAIVGLQQRLRQTHRLTDVLAQLDALVAKKVS